MEGSDCSESNASGAGYTHIVAPSFAAWACLGGFTGLALGKPMLQQMAPQCVYTRPLRECMCEKHVNLSLSLVPLEAFAT